MVIAKDQRKTYVNEETEDSGIPGQGDEGAMELGLKRFGRK